MYERFEQMLIKRGLTPSEVARQTGIARSTFSEWKAGRLTPKTEKMVKIASCLGCTVEYLCGSDVEDDGTYYINPETAKKAQELFEKPGMRILFDAARDASPEDLQAAADILILLKKKGHID